MPTPLDGRGVSNGEVRRGHVERRTGFLAIRHMPTPQLVCGVPNRWGGVGMAPKLFSLVAASRSEAALGKLFPYQF